MEKQTRKKFVFTALGLVAAASVIKWRRVFPSKKKTVTFLTQDGKLVEVDVDRVPATKHVASAEDYQTWLKR